MAIRTRGEEGAALSMKHGFSDITTGPSAWEEMDVASGQTFDEYYEVIVGTGSETVVASPLPPRPNVTERFPAAYRTFGEFHCQRVSPASPGARRLSSHAVTLFRNLPSAAALRAPIAPTSRDRLGAVAQEPFA
jgi:hypothetical protein